MDILEASGAFDPGSNPGRGVYSFGGRVFDLWENKISHPPNFFSDPVLSGFMADGSGMAGNLV